MELDSFSTLTRHDNEIGDFHPTNRLRHGLIELDARPLGYHAIENCTSPSGQNGEPSEKKKRHAGSYSPAISPIRTADRAEASF